MAGLTNNQEQFIYWIKERDSIRVKKEAGHPKPWTDNPVMQNTYFCNVNREDDRVTKWIRANWHYHVDPHGYDLAMVVARLFNQPTTLNAIGQPQGDLREWWYGKAYQTIRNLKDSGQRVWNGAYIVSTNGRKMDKLDYMTFIVQSFLDAYPTGATNLIDTLAGTHKNLTSIDGLGSFLAAQVVADLKNSKGHKLTKAEDWWTFSAHGPGSLRGLSWFFEKEIRPNTYQSAIDEQWRTVEQHLPEDIVWGMCMQNLQSANCEFDKFMRVTNGTGRSKRHYNGGLL